MPSVEAKKMSNDDLTRCYEFSDAWLEAPMAELLGHIAWQAKRIEEARTLISDGVSHVLREEGWGSTTGIDMVAWLIATEPEN